MLYVLAKKVGNVLSLGLSLQGSSAPSLSSTRRDVDSQKRENAPPEISLIATAIVVLKLVYGLDGKQRQGRLRASNQSRHKLTTNCSRLPRNSDDAAHAFPAVDEFLAAVREADHAETHVNSHRFGPRMTLSVVTSFICVVILTLVQVRRRSRRHGAGRIS